MKINHERLRTLIGEIFLGAGCGSDEANCIANHLVLANLSGHDSHGVIRTPIYVGWRNVGKVFANREAKVLFENDSMALVDGQLGFGQWIGQQATNLGIRKCREQGVAVIALQQSGHLGRIGHWAEMAIDAGFVSLNFVNTSGLGMHVVPVGGIDSRLSINPVTLGIPTQTDTPIVLDIAAAMTAEGKLKVARNKGVPVPEGWIIDADGNSTTDPNDFYGPPFGAILPFGGHKGYGLGLVTELLAGAITGSGCSATGKDRLEQGMLSILIDPARLQSSDGVFGEVQRYIEFVKSSRPTESGGEVLVPGEIEQRNRNQRMRDGVDLDEKTWGQIVETAQQCNVSQDVIDAAST